MGAARSGGVTDARTMLRALLPGGMGLGEIMDGDELGDGRADCIDAGIAALLVEEERALGRASERRRREFTRGRACARRALVQLGAPATAVLRGSRGEPLWPVGVVGSITHTAGYAAAITGDRRQFAAVGIDAERLRPLAVGMRRLVMADAERASIEAMANDGVCWDTVIFSAKESVYKAWFTLTRRWLGFTDVAMTIDPQAGTFHARLNLAGPVVAGRAISGFDGRFAFQKGLVVTVTIVGEPAVL